MNDRSFEKLIKTADSGKKPPEGLKERILADILAKNTDIRKTMTLIEKFIFESPLRVACILSLAVSGTLQVVMGSGFTGILNGLLGVR